MTDDPESSLIEDILRFASKGKPMSDHSTSSAVSSSSWNPVTMTADITFRNGKSYSYPCNPEQWFDWKTSGSKGEAFTELFRDK